VIVRRQVCNEESNKDIEWIWDKSIASTERIPLRVSGAISILIATCELESGFTVALLEPSRCVCECDYACGFVNKTNYRPIYGNYRHKVLCFAFLAWGKLFLVPRS
jgi:hypothetical protein